jgi:predicted Zn-dependent protease
LENTLNKASIRYTDQNHHPRWGPIDKASKQIKRIKTIMGHRQKQTRSDQRFMYNRRRFIKYAGILSILTLNPAHAFNIFKLLDPEGESKDLQKLKKILGGAGKILTSSTDLDYKSEFAIGESLALEGLRRYGRPVNDSRLQKYVNLVGNSVARNSKRFNIPFYFVVVKNHLYNAFACPGGIIFVTSTLMQSIDDESQLAGVLAHEVAHVSHKHALKSIRRAKFFQGVGEITAATMKAEEGKLFQDMIGGLQNILFDRGLDKNMEFEADISGMEIAYKTGYNPQGLVRVLNILKQREKAAEKRGSWFSTHPPLNQRIKKCRLKMKSYPDASSMSIVKDRFLYYKKRL